MVPRDLGDRADLHVEAIYGVPELRECHCERTDQFTGLHVREPEGKGYAQKSRVALAGSWKLKFTIAAENRKRSDPDWYGINSLERFMVLPHM